MSYQKKSTPKTYSNSSVGDLLSGRKGLANPAVPALQRQADEEELQMKKSPVQLMEEEEPLQGKFEPVQREEAPEMEEEEPLQGKFEPVQREAAEEEDPMQLRVAVKP